MEKISIFIEPTLSDEKKNKILYLFKDSKNKIIYNLNKKLINTEYIIVFYDLYLPIIDYQKILINIINNIIDIIDIIDISEDNKVILIKKENINVIQNINVKKRNILFVKYENSNPIEHIYPEEMSIEHLKGYKAYKKSYINIFNGLTYKGLKELYINNFRDNKCYFIIFFIDDYNYVDFIINIKDIKYYNVRGIIINNCKNYDNYISIVNRGKILKNFNHIKYNRNFYNIYETITNMFLWFEYVVLINKYKNINIDDMLNIFNKCHKYKDIIYNNSIISGIARIIITSCIFTKEYEYNDYYNTILNNIIYNNDDNNICKLGNYKIKKNRYVIKINKNSYIKKIMNIKDYDFLKIYIENEIKNTKDDIGDLIIKKTSLYFLTKEPIIKIENELNMIILSTENLEVLESLYLLITNSTTNINLINKISLQLIKKTENKITPIIKLCYQNLINSPIQNENTILCLIEITKKMFENNLLKNKLDVLDKISKCMRSCLSNINIIDKFNEIINIDINKINTVKDIEYLNNTNLSFEYIYSLATEFSPYYNSYDEIIKKRDNIKIFINYFINKNIKKYNLTDIIHFPVGNFYMSYQGLSSRDIFMEKSKFMRLICNDLNYKIDSNFVNKKINVLFHSNFLSRKHSVFKDRHQVIKHLSMDPEFNIYFSTFDNISTEIKGSFGKATHIKLEYNLEYCKKIITDLKLDVLVFCEIGMCSFTYFLAHLKLAKKQFNTWGHSDTSGIDSIDYFVSSKLYELEYEESQKNYSEKLLLLNSMCTCYIDPMKQYNLKSFKNRIDFGFTNEYTIYFCAQSSFKFSPMFDDYLIEILQKDKNSIIIMLNHDNQQKILSRFEGKNVSSRFHLFPMQQHFNYLNLIYISDIVLDAYPFGGCNSSLEALSLCKPIITQPSRMINGRFTYGFYKKINLDEMISKNKKEYIKKALQVSQDKIYYNKISNHIKTNKEKLFEDMETIDEWKKILKIN